jgi:tRNA(fMet)-specific endonuclease VapC
MYALDISTVICFLKGTGQVKDRLLSIRPSEIALPGVALFHLELGIAESGQPAKRRAELAQLLKVIAVLDIDSRSAARSAEVAAALRRKGEAADPLQMMIAGTALANGATLVTHNVTEFGRIEGLGIEDWY